MSSRDREDPYPGFRFLVEIDSIVVAGFSEVSGLGIEIDTEEYDEGGINHYTRTLHNGTKHPNLTFKRGLTDSPHLWAWIRRAVEGRAKRHDGRVIMKDYEGEKGIGWEFLGAYPVRWEGPELAADQGAVAMETLEITHRGLDIHGGGP